MIDLEDMSINYPILRHKHTIEPLWGSDTGRNTNSGKFSGTFKGWFDQVVVDFGKTTETQMQLIRGQFEQPIINVRFKDSKAKAWKSRDFYGTAIPAETTDWNGKYEAFQITLTAVEKR